MPTTFQAGPDHADVLVVGAGLAGAAAAAALAAAGRRVVVLDKGRGPGGRLSTRRTEAGAFDHGAASVQAVGPGFRAWLESAVAAGHAAACGDGHWVGVPGMNALVSTPLAGLHPRWSTPVAALLRQPEGAWQAFDDAGGLIASAPWLVLAVPAPQARALLHGALENPAVAEVDAALADVRYAPCWAALLHLEPGCEPSMGSRSTVDAVLERSIREASKPGRSGDGWVLHATAAWSHRELEQPAALVATRMVDAFLEVSGVQPSRVRSASAHRWRYAYPLHGTASTGAPSAGLCLAGDAVGWTTEEPDVPAAERAWRAGRAAAATILAAPQPKS